MTEKWKSVTGYEGFYEVSDCGNIRSIKRTVTNINGIKCNRKGKFLSPGVNKYGYLQVSLSVNNKLSTYTVHSLVAIAFIENSLNKKTVNHIDGKKFNNNVLNLEWATKSEQAIHSLKNNLRKMPNSWNGKFGSSHGSSKGVLQYDKNGLLIKEYGSIIEASDFIKIHPSGITGVCKGKHKTAGGYIWKYKN
jgi:hypothetical protein